MKIGNKYRIARLIKGVTQLQLSQKTEFRISPSKISLFERSQIALSKGEVESLSYALNIPDIEAFLNSFNSEAQNEELVENQT